MRTLRSRFLLPASVAVAIAGAACSTGPQSDDGPTLSAERLGATSQAVTPTPPYIDRKTPKTPVNFLGANNVAAQEEARLYYNAWGAPPTLAAFREAFRFDATGADVAGAVFYNDGDLGIGRLVRCREFGGRRACYAENFGKFGGSKRNALEDAARRRNILNTVAMVYDPSRGATSVNFVAYDSRGAQQLDAELDTVGVNRAIPFNCTNCHGGNYDTATHSVANSRFIPFDLDSFSYPEFNGYRRGDQENELRRLNGFVRGIATEQQHAPVLELIDGWYAPDGVTTRNAKFNGNFVSAGWSQRGLDVDVYRKVIGHYCRNCHLASAPNLREATAVLPSLATVACTAHSMPISEATAVGLWADTDARAAITAATGQACSTPPAFLTPPRTEGECRYKYRGGHVSNRDFFDQMHSCTLGSERTTWHEQCRDRKSESEEIGCFAR